MSDTIQSKKHQAENLIAQEMRQAVNMDQVKGGYDADFYKISKTEEEISIIDDVLSEHNIKDLELTEEQQNALKNVRGRNVSHVLLNSQKFSGDSKEMKRVKDKVAILEKNLREEAVSPEQTALTERAFNEAIEAMTDYKKAKNPWFETGKERMRKVVAQLAQTREEYRFFLIGKAAFKEGIAGEKTTYTALDLIAIGRSMLAVSGVAVDEERDNTHDVIKAVKKIRETKKLREQHDAAFDEYQKERDALISDIDEKVGRDRRSAMDRTNKILVHATAYRNEMDSDDTAAMYLSLSRDFSDCTLEEKKEKIAYLEEFFETILSFDMTKLDFSNLSELWGEHYVSNFIMVAAGHDCEVYIKQYRNLLDGKDASLLALNREQFAEVVARRETLELASNWFATMNVLMQTPGFENKITPDELLAMSVEEHLQGMNGDEKLRSIHGSFLTLKEMTSDEEGTMLYGPGKSISNLLVGERERQKASKQDQTEGALKAISKKLAPFKRRRLDGQVRREVEKSRKGRKTTEDMPVTTSAMHFEKLTADQIKADHIARNKARVEEYDKAYMERVKRAAENAYETRMELYEKALEEYNEAKKEQEEAINRALMNSDTDTFANYIMGQRYDESQAVFKKQGSKKFIGEDLLEIVDREMLREFEADYWEENQRTGDALENGLRNEVDWFLDQQLQSRDRLMEKYRNKILDKYIEENLKKLVRDQYEVEKLRTESLGNNYSIKQEVLEMHGLKVAVKNFRGGYERYKAGTASSNVLSNYGQQLYSYLLSYLGADDCAVDQDRALEIARLLRSEKRENGYVKSETFFSILDEIETDIDKTEAERNDNYKRYFLKNRNLRLEERIEQLLFRSVFEGRDSKDRYYVLRPNKITSLPDMEELCEPVKPDFERILEVYQSYSRKFFFKMIEREGIQ